MRKCDIINDLMVSNQNNWSAARLRHTIFLLLSLSLLGGCAGSLQLETSVDIPAPLVQQLPINVGLYIPEEARNYVYLENSEERPNWSISIGSSKAEFFSKLLTPMFTTLDSLNSLSPTTNEYDAILIPKLQDIQFALPSETGLAFYETWIKYELLLQSPGGNLIARFPSTGFGRFEGGMFDNKADNLQMATNNAFRDLGADIVFHFKRNADVQKWLSTYPTDIGIK
ncbi:hypothetical protein PN836_015440 [Ningiella sp. W23]|uniref:hypothetical protein n=1 Tax=Ningiella sp. W23 TaxID=3023715 RepID=UPI003757AB0B